MKSNKLSPLYFSMYPLNTEKSESVANHVPSASPYLKAILSRRAGTTPRVSVQRLINADRLAAIRYIKESNRRIK